MDWSPNSSKRRLLEACESRGIDASMTMVKAELIALLTAHDIEADIEADQGPPEPPAEPTQLPPLPPIPKFEPTPKPAPQATPEPPQATPEQGGVLDYLAAAEEKVSLKHLVKDLGSEVIEELRELVKANKVTQYKQHNNFWYKAR